MPSPIGAVRAPPVRSGPRLLTTSGPSRIHRTAVCISSRCARIAHRDPGHQRYRNRPAVPTGHRSGPAAPTGQDDGPIRTSAVPTGQRRRRASAAAQCPTLFIERCRVTIWQRVNTACRAHRRRPHRTRAGRGVSSGSWSPVRRQCCTGGGTSPAGGGDISAVAAAGHQTR